MTSADTIRVAARTMLRNGARWPAAVLLVTTLAYAGILAGMAIWADASPLWASSHWVLHWAALAAGFAVAGSLPVLVAHGLSRRTALAAGALVLPVLAAGMAAWVQLGLIAEWAAFRAAGRPYPVDGSHLFDAVGQVHLVLAEYGVQFAGFMVAGWLVFACYHRLGASWGTWVLPFSLTPAVAAVFALSLAWPGGGDSLPWAGVLSPAVALPLALSAALGGLLAIHALTRDAPLPSI